MRSTVRFDWAIKRLLRNKANFDVLEGFLSELLNKDVKIKNILESEGNQQSSDNKTNRVDLLVEDATDNLIIIEVQSNYMHDYLMRMLFGTSKLIVDNMDRGMPYSQIRKVISVNIVYFNIGHGQDYVYHGKTSFTGLHKNDVLTLSTQEQIVFKEEHIEKIYPEYYIIKVNQFDDIARNTLDEWINFLKNEKVNDSTKAKGLKIAREKLDILKLTTKERIEYDHDMDEERDNESVIVSNYMAGELKGIEKGMEQGIEKGIEQGFEKGIEQGFEKGVEQGFEEGIQKERMNIARKCKDAGLEIAAIILITGLTEEQILRC